MWDRRPAVRNQFDIGRKLAFFASRWRCFHTLASYVRAGPAGSRAASGVITLGLVSHVRMGVLGVCSSLRSFPPPKNKNGGCLGHAG